MPLTPDAIPTNEQLRESLADRFYHPHKKLILTSGAVFLALVVGYLAFREFRNARLDDMWSRYHEAEAQFDPNPLTDIDPAAAKKQIDMLSALVRDYPDERVTPFALQQRARAQLAVGDYDAARASLEEIGARFKDFPLNVLAADPDAAGRPRSLALRLDDLIRREKEWAGKRAYVHHWPSEDRLALVETTAGAFWLGFYSEPDEAPNHVASFVQHAKNGDYNGTQVYLVLQSAADNSPLRFECGSRASGLGPDGKEVARDPAEHARDEPADTIEPENSINTIRHLHRVVTSVKMDSGESGMRFMVVAKKPGIDSLNGEHTPFAAVVDREGSLDVIDQIGRASTYGNHPETKDSALAFRMRDHPYPPIYIRRVSIWSKEKLEDGHPADVVPRIAKSVPEPWEATRVAPKPDEFASEQKK